MNPCEDFGHFVWPTLHADHVQSWKSHLKLQLAWAKRTAKSLQSSTFTFNATRKAASMFNSCIDSARQDLNKSVTVLKKFMKERRLSWPDAPPSTVEPLDVLLDLAVNWQLPLWFRIVLMTPPQTPRQVTILPLEESLFFLTDFSGSRYTEVYRQRWTHYFNLLSQDASDAASESRITKLLEVQNDVIQLLLSFKKTRTYGAHTLRIGDVEASVPSFTTTKLVTLFNKYIHVVPELNEKDEFVSGNVETLKDLFKIFSRHKNTDILDLLGWWLVQILGITMAEAALDQPFQSIQDPPSFLTLYCAIQVEDVYTLMLTCDDASRRVPYERRSLDIFFNTILRAANSWLDKTTAINEENKQIAMGKLSTITVNLWPKEEHVCGDVLWELYSNFPEDEDLFINYWIWARGNASVLARTSIGQDFAQLPHFFYDRPLYYDPLLNSVTISTAALAGPLYYPDGTKSMLYGGLGVAFAVEVAKVFIVFADLLDESARNVTTASETPANACSSEVTDVFHESVALRIAHHAYKEALAHETDPRLEYLSDYSGEQVFFITWCYIALEYRGSQTPQRVCTSATQGFGRFADVFRCPRGIDVTKSSNKCG